MMRLRSALVWRVPRIRDVACALLMLFLVMFPKGGIKAGSIPITWGYVLLAMFAVVTVPFSVISTCTRMFPKLVVLELLALMPFQVMLLLSMANCGSALPLADAIAALIDFFVLPWVFLVLWRYWYDAQMEARMLALLRLFVFSAALFGVVMFIVRIVTGKMLEIPLLTVNLGDYGHIDDKDNLRGGLVMKLVSTYNNGNVYGAATLILLPVFDVLESRRWRRVLVRLALVLTLSRTAWIGLIVERSLALWPEVVAMLRRLPRISLFHLRRMALPMMAMVVLVVLVMTAAMLLPDGLSMLTDSSLGGRVNTFDFGHAITLFPEVPFWGFAEMVYVSALGEMGVLGFLSMLGVFYLPCCFSALDAEIARSPLRSAAVRGVLVYAVIAWSDGAIELIPVMCFYWMTIAIAFYSRSDMSGCVVSEGLVQDALEAC